MDLLKTLLTDFTLFDSWEDKYRYLIDCGERLLPLREEERIMANKVSGCVSQVWLVREDIDGRLFFRGTSDAHIVRGLIYLLFAAYSGKKVDEILALDIEGIFSKLGLSEHLSPQRSSGFYAMVERIRFYARSGVNQ